MNTQNTTNNPKAAAPPRNLLEVLYAYSEEMNTQLRKNTSYSKSCHYKNYGIHTNTKLRELNEQAQSFVLEGDESLIYADLSELNFSGLNLLAVDQNGDPIGAIFKGANLYNVNFQYANLSNAKMQYTNLCCANLSGADLSGADLRDSRTNSVILKGSNGLSDLDFYTNIQGAIIDDKTQCPNGFFFHTAGQPIINNNPWLERGLCFAIHILRRAPLPNNGMNTLSL